MVKVFTSLREAKKFIKSLPCDTAYKILNISDQQIFVFYRPKEKRLVKPPNKSFEEMIPQNDDLHKV